MRSFRKFIIVFNMMALVGCGSHKNKDKDKEQKTLPEQGESHEDLQTDISQLKQEIAENQRKIQQLKDGSDQSSKNASKLKAKNAQLQKDLELKNTQVAALEKSVADRAKEIAGLKSSNEDLSQAIAARNADIEKLGREITAKQQVIADLQAKIDQSATETSDLKKQVVDLGKAKDELSAQLAKARQEASALNLEKEANLNKIATLGYQAVQAFLENLGQERLFIAGEDTMQSFYNLDASQDCLAAFAIGSQLKQEVAPVLRNQESINITIPYQRILVCKIHNGNTTSYRAMKDDGVIFKAIPNNNTDRRILELGRKSSSCASGSKSAFGDSYQSLDSYTGSIDGYETLNLLSQTGVPVEYNMGSSTPDVFAESCEALLQSQGQPSPQAKIACELATGRAVTTPVQLGCAHETLDANHKRTIIFE